MLHSGHRPSARTRRALIASAALGPSTLESQSGPRASFTVLANSASPRSTPPSRNSLATESLSSTRVAASFALSTIPIRALTASAGVRSLTSLSALESASTRIFPISFMAGAASA